MSRTSPFARFWSLDPDVRFLNHGSFGACPVPVLQHQAELRERLERQPLRFLHRELEGLMDRARAALGSFLGADPDDLALVHNATTGVNTVLRSLEFEPGDEVLVTDHEYNACRNALDFVARRANIEVRVVPVPFPVASAEDVEQLVLEQVTANTRLLLIDHVTSSTAMVLPVQTLVRTLRERGVDTLIDGAHAPGMLDLDLAAIGAAYYTGNCHKWLCAPKGAAFLHVRRDRQDRIRPLVISHGANSKRTDRSRFRIEADWIGTSDPTAWLSVPAAIEFLGNACPGGWSEVRARNRALVLHGRELLCEALGIEPPCPADMIGSLASVPLPDGEPGAFQPPLFLDPLQDTLLHEDSIEVPIMFWPKPPRRLLRISAQLYNARDEYRALADALRSRLG